MRPRAGVTSWQSPSSWWRASSSLTVVLVSWVVLTMTVLVAVPLLSAITCRILLQAFRLASASKGTSSLFSRSSVNVI